MSKQESKRVNPGETFKARYRKRNKALDRVVAAWQLYLANGDGAFGVALDRAVDHLAIAHVTMTLGSCLDP
jgi:23S rRNA G2069 N7-methylase RlmK/C1962 C5-methylase RlmI